MNYHRKHTFISHDTNKKNRQTHCFSLDWLTCVSSSRCRIQSTSNCLTTAFLDSPSMRGRWGWKAHRVTRLLRSDQASCMMRKYGPPLLNLHYVTCVWQIFYESGVIQWGSIVRLVMSLCWCIQDTCHHTEGFRCFEVGCTPY